MQKRRGRPRKLPRQNATDGATADATANVPLRPGDAERLQGWCDRHGRIKRDSLGMMIQTFVDAPEPVKRWMLGEIEGEMAGAYAKALRAMARDLEQPARVEAEGLETGGVSEASSPASHRPAHSPSL